MIPMPSSVARAARVNWVNWIRRLAGAIENFVLFLLSRVTETDRIRERAEGVGRRW